ncbi:tryptophan--tRNA ligase, partial [Candidatus Woesearchaeota archaeon]|nr:tryptophan--tRNA ligase [Candidatus Woesearchaeota archaeon]
MTKKSNPVVTPWEVKGKIDYDKLIKQFGLKQLQHLPEQFQKNVL